MTEMTSKHIILGITGGIAAYKAAELTRLLIKQGHSVRVVMTQAATAFITPMTLQALSGHPVHCDLLDEQAEAAMGHIELARWADVIVIAPCSANTLAKLAHGLADNLLTTLCLASAAPLFIAPAMNQQMWRHAATQANLTLLKQRGVELLGPDSGSQACGDNGMGRMLAPDEIVPYLTTPELDRRLLAHTRIVITAGATREPLDPVRFISNRSSGKMGYALAHAAERLGATVQLISGVTSIKKPAKVAYKLVETAEEMLIATEQAMREADIFIASAAVVDYAPVQQSPTKIKKSAPLLQLNLQKNPDILATLSQRYPDVFSVGFAAETHDLEHYARAKLVNKGLDMIAANYVGKTQGFDQDDNALQVFWQNGQQTLPMQAKNQLAYALLGLVAQRYQAKLV
ncbi:MAG: bifunctional phosphopantothenoylcysteine decarboxylase/phosphopantothenate--cysteine ligase CoaBC [bacterium]